MVVVVVVVAGRVVLRSIGRAVTSGGVVRTAGRDGSARPVSRGKRAAASATRKSRVSRLG